jgi:hypothetical protein
MAENYTNAGMAHHMDAFLSEMREVLDRLPAEAAPAPAPGHGIAANGRVRATVGHRGYLTDLAIDRHWALMVDHQTLINAVKEAVRIAVDDVHRQIDELPPMTDQLDEMVEALDSTLNEISNGLSRVIGQGSAT